MAYDYALPPRVRDTIAPANVTAPPLPSEEEQTRSERLAATFEEAFDEKKAELRKWLQFLLSKEMQQKAIEVGFRPVNPDVTVRGHDVEANRFLRLRRYGVLAQPHWTEAPRTDGRLVQELLSLWGEVTGRN